MDKPEPTFSLDELLAQLKADECIGGLTNTELCDMAGLPTTQTNMNKVRNRVKDMIALGEWEFKGKKPLRAIDGHMHSVPAYGPIEK